jgi:gas vesicle protein
MSDHQIETIKAEAAQAAEQGKDLRALVRDMTLRALSRRSLSVSDIMAVVKAVTEGVSLGLGRRAGELKDAAHEALGGLDEAVKKTAEATKLAAQQLVSQGKEFGEQDLKPAVDELKKVEEMFLNTVAKVTEAAGGRIKEEFAAQISHARRNGTDSGRVIADTVAEFNQRVAATVKTGASQTASAALDMTQRLTLLASGILAGMSEALHDKAKSDDKSGAKKVH